jgi:hypothetical protein
VNTDTTHFLSGMSMPLIDPGFLSEILSTASDITLVLNADKIVTAVRR